MYTAANFWTITVTAKLLSLSIHPFFIAVFSIKTFIQFWNLGFFEYKLPPLSILLCFKLKLSPKQAKPRLIMSLTEP